MNRVEALRQILPPIERNPAELRWPSDGQCWLLAGADSEPRLAPVALDCEWDRETRELTLIGIGNREKIAQFWWRELSLDKRYALGKVIARIMRERTVIIFSASADVRVMRHNGIPIELHRDLARVQDPMLLHAVLHCEEEHGLEYLCSPRGRNEDGSYTGGGYGKLPPHKDLMHVDLSVYNAADVLQELFVWEELLREGGDDAQAMHVYFTRRQAKLPTVIEEEERGIAVNKALAIPIFFELDAKRREARNLARAWSGFPLSMSSPDQVKFWMYDVEKFPEQYVTRGRPSGGSEKRSRAGSGHQNSEEGNLTSGKDAVSLLRRANGAEWDENLPATFEQAWANIERGCNPFLEAKWLFSGAQQQVTHYVTKCLYMDEKTKLPTGVRDRVYPEIRQHVQTSGRVSYVGTDWPDREGIAAQQLRGRTEKLIRPDDGYVWVGHDWSNIETWILEHLAQDQVLAKAKREGWDTHTLNVCDVLGLPKPPILTKALHESPECADWRRLVQWTGDEDLRRTWAKRWVYRLHYLGDPANATDIPGSQALGIDEDRSVALSNIYLGIHHWIVEWWNKIEAYFKRHGKVYAPGGMPRVLTSLSHNENKRRACNHPMQGGVAWVYDTVYELVYQMIRAFKFDAWFAFGKHDSHWWAVRKEQADDFDAFYRPIVERTFVIEGRETYFPASFKRRAA